MGQTISLSLKQLQLAESVIQQHNDDIISIYRHNWNKRYIHKLNYNSYKTMHKKPDIVK